MGIEAQASLRSELSGELSAARFELEKQLAELQRAGDSGSIAAEVTAQLSVLSALQTSLSGGGHVTRAEVTASITAARSVAHQASARAEAAHLTEAVHHEMKAAAEARRVTQDFVHDFYEKRIFDKYLQFETPEAERAYREREAEREREIRKAQAENTPEGELRANRIAQEQLKDAGTHGADRSPDFARYQGQLLQQETNLGNAIASTPPNKPVNEQRMEEALAPSDPNMVPPELIAVLRQNGVAVATAEEGHGVSQGKIRTDQIQRV